MDRIYTDILGPLPTSDNGMKYVLLVQDQFTKWIECYAIPDQTAETVAHKIVFEFISRFGAPLSIHSDQGKNYESHLFQQVCDLLEIRKVHSSLRHPHSSTGYSLNMMMLGRETHQPVELLFGEPDQGDKHDPNGNVCDYVVHIKNKMANIYDLVRDHFQKNCNRQLKDHDISISFNNYNVGDLVYVRESNKIY